MHPLDIGILLAFIAYAVHSGLRCREVASRDMDEYFLAGRSLSGVEAGLSMAATQFAADTPLLVTGLIATGGIFALWRLWVYAAAFLLLGFVLAPCWRRARVLTDAELSELRYGGRGALLLRATKAVYFGLIFNCTVLAMVMFAAVRIAQPFLTWHAWLPAWLFDPITATVTNVGVPLGTAAATGDIWVSTADNLLSLIAILSVTAFYSTAGGLRSVVRTDMLQLGLALGGTLVFAVCAVSEVGGLSALHERLAGALAQHPTGMSRGQLLAFTPGAAAGVSTALLTTLGLQWLIQMNADGTGYLAQRCMACRNDADATRATVIFAWTQIVFRSLLWLPIGLSMLVLFPPGVGGDVPFVDEREQTYVLGMLAVLPVGARGLLLTAMLAALASTLDTHLNWGASYLSHDLYDRVYRQALRRERASPRRLVTVARVSNLLIVVLSLVVMTQLSSIQMAWKIGLLLGSGMGIVLVMRWLWWRITAPGELAAMVAATALSPWALATFPDEQEAMRMLIVALGAALCGVIVSWSTSPRPGDPGLQAFYSKTRPPGLWGPVAALLGESPRTPLRRLGRGLLRMLLTCLSLFCALVGLGSWLVHGTVPAWMSPPGLWSPTLLLVSALLGLAAHRVASRDLISAPASRPPG